MADEPHRKKDRTRHLRRLQFRILDNKARFRLRVEKVKSVPFTIFGDAVKTESLFMKRSRLLVSCQAATSPGIHRLGYPRLASLLGFHKNGPLQKSEPRKSCKAWSLERYPGSINGDCWSNLRFNVGSLKFTPPRFPKVVSLHNLGRIDLLPIRGLRRTRRTYFPVAKEPVQQKS